jgi:glycosyltransferase involved in cell wall biosynthesis
VSAEQLRSYYRQARGLLQPGTEDFGMAAAEALACGTPVIAFEQGGVQEIVEHGRHGLLYKEQALEALAEAIRQFLRLEREGKFMPEQLQRRAFLFSRERFQTQVQQIVEETLRKKNNQYN